MKKIKTKNNLLTKLEVKGNNISNFLNTCATNGLIVMSINKKDKSTVELEVSEKDYKSLKKINTIGYEVKVLSIGGIKKILNFCLYRIGLIVGMTLSIIAMLILNNRLFTIHIYGLSALSESEIVQTINEFGINTFSKLDFDTEKLENYLMSKHDLSLVSIITKGNSLIVSVKEELPDVSEKNVPITADFNMVITKIKTFSGTSMVKEGDIVYAGDILVEPFVKSGQDIVYVEPRADIEAKVFFSSSYNFYYTEEKMVRTGEKKIVNSSIYLGKIKLFEKNKDIPFEDYETTDVCTPVTNYFLPLQIHKTYAYNLKPMIFENNYDNEREGIINKVKQMAYDQVPSSLKVEKEDVIEKNIDGGKLINVSLMCNLSISYKNFTSN